MIRGTRNKIEEVFMDLYTNGSNILACPEIGDCSSCAIAALNEIFDKHKKEGKTFIGAVYCHAQDWEAAKEEDSLFIGFIDFPSDDEHDMTVLKDIGISLAAALQAKGFQVTWDGNPENKIEVYVGRKRKCGKRNQATKQ